MHHFVSIGDIEQVSLLLDDGADTAAPNCTGLPPIHVAIRLQQNECVRLLLERGADPNLPTGSGNTPLITAINCKNDDAVRYLLKYRADPNIPNARGELPIFHAIHMHNPVVVENLCAKKSKRSYNGNSALLYAIKLNDPECVRVLLAKGTLSELDTKDSNGHTPRDYASGMKDPSIELLIHILSAGGSEVKCAKGSQFVEAMYKYFSNAIDSAQKTCEEKKPVEMLKCILELNHKLKRFTELLRIKETEVSREIAALARAPPTNSSSETDAMIAGIIEKWSARLAKTGKLHRQLQSDLITTGSQTTLQKWEHIIRGRREFLESLLSRDIDESQADRALAEQRESLTSELASVKDCMGKMDAKSSAFKHIAKEVTTFAVSQFESLDVAKTECGSFLDKVSTEFDIDIDNLPKAAPKDDGEERPVRVVRSAAKKRRPT